jgi:hypothetical protein
MTPFDTTASRETIIDEYGELSRKVLEFKPTLQKHEALKKTIAGWYESLPGEETATAQGKLYSIQVGMRENRRTITNPKRAFNLLKKALGLEKTIETVTIPLKALDAHCSVLEQRSILKQERTGPREIIAVARAPVEAAKKAA